MSYKPLDSGIKEIRLLHVHPASTLDDPIRCHLAHASLNEEPEFEALSYVWGKSPNEDKPSIELEGRMVQITVNLYAALRRLRFDEQEHNQDRILWVDALCINQPDSEEKKHQIPLMRSIYSRASQVVVWLGEEWPGSNVAMEFLRVLGDDPTLHLDPAEPHSIKVDGRGLDSPDLRSGICHLFALPWWKRTWTVQEFVLARKTIIQCGSTWINGDSFDKSRQTFYLHSDVCCNIEELDILDPVFETSLISSFAQPSKLHYIINNPEDSQSVLSAVAEFSQREAEDPRDKVYGMLGLGKGKYENLVEADYSLSEEEVCEELAFKSVEKTGTLEFLSHLFPDENKKLPSFIPNWTGSYEWHSIYEDRLNYLSLFDASFGSVAIIKRASHSLIMLPGVVVDKIDATAQTSMKNYEFESLQGIWEEVHRLAGMPDNSTKPYPHSCEPQLVALWHTLCGGMKMILKDSNRWAQRLKGSYDLTSYSKFNAWIAASPEEKPDLWDHETQLTYSDIAIATWGRRFFRTESGYFGFGPKSCKTGDTVAVLAGGKVPYIIRPTFCCGGDFTMLGDSIVHGIMDGEVFDILPEGKREFRDLSFN